LVGVQHLRRRKLSACLSSNGRTPTFPCGERRPVVAHRIATDGNRGSASVDLLALPHKTTRGWRDGRAPSGIWNEARFHRRDEAERMSPKPSHHPQGARDGRSDMIKGPCSCFQAAADETPRTCPCAVRLGIAAVWLHFDPNGSDLETCWQILDEGRREVVAASRKCLAV